MPTFEDLPDLRKETTVRILLTGATGFVGFHCLQQWLEDAKVKQIITPVRDPGKLRAKLAYAGHYDIPSKIRVETASAPDWELPPPVWEGVTHAVHAAAVLFGRDRNEYHRINVEGSVRLARRLPRNCRLLLVSSQSAGGPTPAGFEARDETNADEPLSEYGSSKLAMEKAVASQKECVILRPPMVLGAGDTATLPLFQIARMKIRPKPGLQDKIFSWIAVDDLASAIGKALTGNLPMSKPYYVSSEGTVSDRHLLELAGIVQRRDGWVVPLPKAFILGAATLAGFLPAIQTAIPSLAPDRAKELIPDRWVIADRAFRKATRWKPSASIDQTMAETCKYYLQTGQLPA
jgi:nucleoside-diphosphate-sugar epimerase